MNEDGIPDDIRSAAVAVVDRGYNEGLIDAVCAALMAERERCARIAEANCDGCYSSISDAIRRGTP